MLIVRFKETFRERMPEWVQATGMIGWGFMALAATGLFQVQEFFHPLLTLMPQFEWGLLALGVGLLRLTFLVINGAWRPSAHIRAVGCAMGSMLWGSLFISALNLMWLTPTTAIYAMLLGMDLMSLWFSAGDAKLADLAARGKLKVA
ncbi:MAG: hypothetical protein EOO61_03075 [Hymenobacter sp.]|nr:MAG: hypothetical protein EOO61_03075 [Hymenobacter sp.]